MASKSQAGLGAILDNHRDLVIQCQGNLLYDPAKDNIRIINYEPFVAQARQLSTPLAKALGRLEQAQDAVVVIAYTMKKRSRDLRSAFGEFFLPGSEPFKHISGLVDIITGDNNTKASQKRKAEKEKAEAEAKKKLAENKGSEGNDQELPPAPVEYRSVSQQDAASVIKNFGDLVDQLSEYTDFTPNESEVQQKGLNALRAEGDTAINKLSEAEKDTNNARSDFQPVLLDLKERATAAKLHVKRKNGASSIQFKAIANKKYY